MIEVGAPDRIGLLYDITSALAELTLDVHLAKVATYTDRVIDSFYVRDALGRKVTDARQVDEIGSVVAGPPLRLARGSPDPRTIASCGPRGHRRCSRRSGDPVWRR